MSFNCENCGASLTIERYEDWLKCAYCGTVLVPSLRDDGLIQKLDGVASTTACPVCTDYLFNAKLGVWTFLYCRKCHGLLVDGAHLSEIIVYCRRDAREPYRQPEPIDPGELCREIHCPRCAALMSTHEYYGPGDFVIDSCRDCRHVWLDAGELGRTTDVRWGGSLWR